ncbi:alginate export family protein [Runella sp.]|uniref:alginate export family protein n=1 Tax=Runella sp. TaxID=1960881 RepID=UPI003D0EC6DF
MKKPLHGKCFGVLLLIFSLSKITHAQLSLQGQLRTRTELRDGLGNLPKSGTNPAAFTSQRTSLNFGYKWDRLTFGINVRDVRVWGQDAASINNADGSKLFLHEAWAEIILANRADTTFKFRAFDNLSLKIGRQELVYDDVRLLGNLDWLQQGRRFDMALLKGVKKGWQIDFGVAFNQNSDAFGRAGTFYAAGNAPATVANSKGVFVSIPTDFLPTSGKGGAPVLASPLSTNGQNQMFKAMQMLYISRKFGQTKFSGLFFKDDFQKYRIDSLGSTANGVVYGRRYDVEGVNSRITYGAMLTGLIANAAFKSGKIAWQAFAYKQGGKNRDGQSLSAYHYGANVSIQKGKFSFGPGYEFLSGNNTVSPDNKDRRFDPLYGTPHKHWGYMDYFYVGTGAPAGGLANAFFKAKYVANPNLYFTFDIHHFALANDMKNSLDATGGKINRQLGNEFDFILNYNLNRFTNVELGYCYLKGSNSLEYAKLGTMDKTKHSANWAYLMLNIRPDFLYTKAGK